MELLWKPKQKKEQRLAVCDLHVIEWITSFCYCAALKWLCCLLISGARQLLRLFAPLTLLHIWGPELWYEVTWSVVWKTWHPRQQCQLRLCCAVSRQGVPRSNLTLFCLCFVTPTWRWRSSCHIYRNVWFNLLAWDNSTSTMAWCTVLSGGDVYNAVHYVSMTGPQENEKMPTFH